MKTRDFLLESGIYPNLLGFNYTLRAVELVKENNLIKVYDGIYEQIAKEFYTKPRCVERAIRNVIQHIKLEDFKKVGVNFRLTNGQFIHFLAFMEG